MCETVVASGAHLGIALDGDADRLIVCDEVGRIVDGDQLMATIATNWARRGLLRGGGLVATVMSNLGLERPLAAEGLNLLRTRVGDRHVLEAMSLAGYHGGGVQAGHIIRSDYPTARPGPYERLPIPG